MASHGESKEQHEVLEKRRSLGAQEQKASGYWDVGWAEVKQGRVA